MLVFLRTITGFFLFAAHHNFAITLHRKVTFQVMWIYAKVQQIDINIMYHPNIACRFNILYPKKCCVSFNLQHFVHLFEITNCFYSVLCLAIGYVLCILISRCLALYWRWLTGTVICCVLNGDSDCFCSRCGLYAYRGTWFVHACVSSQASSFIKWGRLKEYFLIDFD